MNVRSVRTLVPRIHAGFLQPLACLSLASTIATAPSDEGQVSE
jgi:hypothetical protein